MQNILKTILGLGALAAVQAAPITFIDIVAPNNVYLNQGATFSFTHNILDNGFNAATDAITDADLYFLLSDDLDFGSEKVRISLDNLIVNNSIEVDYGIYHFNVNSVMLQSDGVLNVSLNVLAGDFLFLGSTLDVAAERTAPAAVPEPTTWALMAMGLLGMTYASRRKRA